MNTNKKKKRIRNKAIKGILFVAILILFMFFPRFIGYENYTLEKQRVKGKAIDKKYCYIYGNDSLYPIMPIRTIKDKDLLFEYYFKNTKPENIKWNKTTSLIFFDTSKVEIIKYLVKDSLALIRTTERDNVLYVPIFCLKDTLPSSYK